MQALIKVLSLRNILALVLPLMALSTSATANLFDDEELHQTAIIGTVFFDANLNGYRDEGEQGIPAVRLATVTGLVIETDGYGRFHIPDGSSENSSFGSSHLLKVDIHSLPQGAKITTENPRLLRGTSVLNKINFGVVF